MAMEAKGRNQGTNGYGFALVSNQSGREITLKSYRAGLTSIFHTVEEEQIKVQNGETARVYGALEFWDAENMVVKVWTKGDEGSASASGAVTSFKVCSASTVYVNEVLPDLSVKIMSQSWPAIKAAVQCCHRFPNFNHADREMKKYIECVHVYPKPEYKSTSSNPTADKHETGSTVPSPSRHSDIKPGNADGTVWQACEEACQDTPSLWVEEGQGIAQQKSIEQGNERYSVSSKEEKNNEDKVESQGGHCNVFWEVSVIAYSTGKLTFYMAKELFNEGSNLFTKGPSKELTKVMGSLVQDIYKSAAKLQKNADKLKKGSKSLKAARWMDSINQLLQIVGKICSEGRDVDKWALFCSSLRLICSIGLLVLEHLSESNATKYAGVAFGIVAVLVDLKNVIDLAIELREEGFSYVRVTKLLLEVIGLVADIGVALPPSPHTPFFLAVSVVVKVLGALIFFVSLAASWLPKGHRAMRHLLCRNDTTSKLTVYAYNASVWACTDPLVLSDYKVEIDAGSVEMLFARMRSEEEPEFYVAAYDSDNKLVFDAYVDLGRDHLVIPRSFNGGAHFSYAVHGIRWCLFQMKVSYTTIDNVRLTRWSSTDWSNGLYTGTIRVEPHATEIQVSFEVRGGAHVSKVDRQLNWVKDEKGNYVKEIFEYEQSNCKRVHFHLRGTSQHGYVACVDDGNSPEPIRTDFGVGMGLCSSCQSLSWNRGCYWCQIVFCQPCHATHYHSCKAKPR